MRLPAAVIEELRVDPGDAAQLDRRSTEHTSADWLHGADGSRAADLADRQLAQRRRFLARLENPEKHWKFCATASTSVVDAIEALDLRMPEPREEQRTALADARRRLESEPAMAVSRRGRARTRGRRGRSARCTRRSAACPPPAGATDGPAPPR